MSDYRDIFSNGDDRYDQPNQPNKRPKANLDAEDSAPITPDEISGGKLGSAPVVSQSDDFVIGSGFKISECLVTMKERMAGSSYLSFWNSVKYMLRTSLSILLIQFVRQPIRKEENA